MMITYVLIAITVAISFYALSRPAITNQWLHIPYREHHQGEYIRLLSSGFLHGSQNHFFINMFVLWQFGTICEQYFMLRFGDMQGRMVFIGFYISAIIVANLGTFFRHKDNPGFRSLGASGVTSALVLIYCLFDPWQMFLFPPVPAIVFAVLYLVYSQWAISGRQDNIDHQGHLWGALYGIVFIALFDSRLFSHFWERLMDIPFLS